MEEQREATRVARLRDDAREIPEWRREQRRQAIEQLEKPPPKKPRKKFKITPELFDTTKIEEERDESIPHLIEHTD